MTFDALAAIYDHDLAFQSLGEEVGGVYVNKSRLYLLINSVLEITCWIDGVVIISCSSFNTSLELETTEQFKDLINDLRTKLY